jgi:hypothetical protein
MERAAGEVQRAQHRAEELAQQAAQREAQHAQQERYRARMAVLLEQYRCGPCVGAALKLAAGLAGYRHVRYCVHVMCGVPCTSSQWRASMPAGNG